MGSGGLLHQRSFVHSTCSALYKNPPTAQFCLRKFVLMSYVLLQRRNVDHEPVFHVTPQHSLVGFVDVIDLDFLDVAGDSALGAEIEHLLSLGDSADERAGETMTPTNKTEWIDRDRLRRKPDQRQCAVAFEQTKKRIEIVLCRNGVDDEI